MDIVSPLFLAHQNGRKAEKFLKKKEFDKAIECHVTATAFLQEAMTLTSYARCLESLQLQKNYHLSQTDIIRAKKGQYTHKKQLAELRKKKMEKKRILEADKKNKDMEREIRNTMDLADSLIVKLSENHNEFENIGYRRIEDERKVVENLRVVNTKLRSQINILVHQFHLSQREAEDLRFRLKLYEGQNLPDLPPLELPNFDFTYQS